MLSAKCTICDNEKWKNYQETGSRRAIKYDWWNSDAWKDSNIMTKENYLIIMYLLMYLL